MSRGSRANGPDAETPTRFSRRALSDELGYASGDGRHRITVDFARDSRHGKYNLQSRAVRVSSARESVHTRASAGKTGWKNLEPDHRQNAAPLSPAKPSDGMLNWRHGRTRGLPDNYSGPSRDVSSQALNGFLTGFGRQRARGARVEPASAGACGKKSGGYDPTFTYLTNNGRVRERCESRDPGLSRVAPSVRDARRIDPNLILKRVRGPAAPRHRGVASRASHRSFPLFCFVY